MNAPNRHAALMRQYTEEHILDPEAYRNWESWRPADPLDCWGVCQGHPKWKTELNYRRKAKTITIGGVEVPEPMRVAPEHGSVYYMAQQFCGDFFGQFQWTDDNFDRNAINKGMCHKTKEAAIAHAKAIIIASGGKVGE